jgi:hypothetical protein
LKASVNTVSSLIAYGRRLFVLAFSYIYCRQIPAALMAHSPKNTLPPDFHNPFEGRNPDEVWQELGEKAEPISREEFFRRLQAHRQAKEQNPERTPSAPDEKGA